MQRDIVAFVIGLEGFTDASVVFQLVGRPVPDVPERGTVAINLLAVVDDTPDATERLNIVTEDLLDLSTVAPTRWTFEPIDDDAGLKNAVSPVPTTHTAEIARSEHPLWNDDAWAEAGFRPQSRQIPALWAMWHLSPPTTPDLARLARVLLAQDHPVAIRTMVAPTKLTDVERRTLEELIQAERQGPPRRGLHAAALHSVEPFLVQRQLFEVRLTVASGEPLSAALLSALGHSVSEPQDPVKDGQMLRGGFTVVRARDGRHDDTIAAAHNLGRADPLSGLGPAGLSRLRHLMPVRETAGLAWLPATEDDFPGVDVVRTPALPPEIDRLPTMGTRIGRLVGFGRHGVHLDPVERFRHMYVSGQTGTGKSTLLLNCALDDIRRGVGVVVLDPHGDLVDEILGRVPDDRIDDVVLIDPADPDAVVGLNLLEAETPTQSSYVLTELSEMFQRLFDPQNQGIVGPRFQTIFRQCAMLLQQSDMPSSFLDVTTPLADQAVRQEMLQQVTDPILLEFWHGEMTQNKSNEQWEVIAWVRSKFEVFRTSPLLRRVLGQTSSTVSFTDALASQRIILVNLSKGLLGEYNSAMLGYLVFMKLWAAALERVAIPADERPEVQVYVDEFQNMTNRSLPDVLSEARKFRLGLTLANQFFTQIPEDTRDSLMGNVATRITLRMGPRDAGAFATWLGEDVGAREVTSLPNYTAIAATSARGVPIDPMVVQLSAPDDDYDRDRAAEVRRRSNARWATPIDGLDHAFFTRWAQVDGSFAQRAAAARVPKEPEPDTTFIDDWLQSDERRHDRTPAPTPDPE